MADETTTQASPESADPQPEPAANPGGDFWSAFERTFSVPGAELKAPPSTVAAEPVEPTDAEPSADSGDEPSTADATTDPSPPSRREKARQRDEARDREATARIEQEVQARLEAERRNAELDRQLHELQAKQQEAVRRGLEQIGTQEEREALIRTLRTADPYTDERYEQAKARLDEMDRHAEVFAIQREVMHRAYIGSAARALFEKAVQYGMDPRAFSSIDDPEVVVGDHIRTIADGVAAARDTYWQAELAKKDERIAALEEQLETDRIKLAGHAEQLPSGGRSARQSGERAVFDPNRSPQENLAAAAEALVGPGRR